MKYLRCLLGIIITLTITLTITSPVFAAGALDDGHMDYLPRFVTSEKVNLRNAPSTEAEIIKTLSAGTIVAEKMYTDDWSLCMVGGQEGYIKTEFLVEMNKYIRVATELALAGDAPIKFTNDAVNFRKAATTDADILAKLTRNTKVSIIVEDGEWSRCYVSGEIGYIKTEFLSDKETNLVSLTPWSEASGIFTIGVAAKVYDCYTGLTYYVKSFSNGNHADVEPVTTEDTAILKRTYGGTWDWTPRPVWVTINGVTMAASINGMPHGGGVNNSNGMNGQVCIHFLGSTTHNGNKSFARDHQDALMVAYRMAQ